MSDAAPCAGAFRGTAGRARTACGGQGDAIASGAHTMTDPTLPIRWRAPDGTPMSLRRIGTHDFDAARTFLRALSYGTRYFRFGRGDFVYPDEEIRRLLDPDPAVREHVVAFAGDGEAAPMVGSARYVVQPGREACEFSIVVLDGWQKHGVGGRLMAALIGIARARGLATMTCRVLGTNTRMHDFVRSFGFLPEEPDTNAAILTYALALR